MAGNVLGEITVDGDVTSSGSIIVEKLGDCFVCGGVATVLVEGLCEGEISVKEHTGAASLIQMVEGLASGATVTVNSSEGAFDANGDIRVGSTNTTPPLDDVTYDGCIQILDDGSSSGGDLNGDIIVVGCHAGAAALNICIEGSENGDVEIIETDCEVEVVGYTCIPGAC